jgi:antibiotic biosynthesis monooxygenase (ABM) superfamily enzyme
VILVSSVELAPGTEADHRALHEEGVLAAARLGGLVQDELLPAVPGVQRETVALLTFATRDDLDRWRSSKERHRVLDRMQRLLVATSTVNVVGGFAGWFHAARLEPKRWKQALTILIAFIPDAVIVTAALAALLPDLVMSAARWRSRTVNFAVLTWVLMRTLTRRLAPWLAA